MDLEKTRWCVASGNSSSQRSYQLTHANPVTGNNYYRILQIDLNGKSSYSDTRMVKYTNPLASIQVYPNPALANSSVQVQSNEVQLLRLFNSSGQMVWQQQVYAGLVKIALQPFAKGVYYLKGKQETVKLVIQ